MLLTTAADMKGHAPVIFSKSIDSRMRGIISLNPDAIKSLAVKQKMRISENECSMTCKHGPFVLL